MDSIETKTGAASMNLVFARDILVRFIKDELAAAGFSKAVVGLSGGVDSAVVAALAAEALGPKNVHALSLPHKQSSKTSAEDAQLVAETLKVRHETIDISPMVDGFQSVAGPLDKLRLGNAMARARMIVLYDRSAKDRGLVLGTSNKTEILLGYGTQFGDLASAINPIGDLYKTQIWMLAKELRLPQRVIDKAPTADLWSGQTDEKELGFSYKEADRLLFAMVDERRTDAELHEAGFKPDFVKRVRELLRKNQFKRRPPLIAKISYRTVNVDFQYVRDWGV